MYRKVIQIKLIIPNKINHTYQHTYKIIVSLLYTQNSTNQCQECNKERDIINQKMIFCFKDNLKNKQKISIDVSTQSNIKQSRNK